MELPERPIFSDIRTRYEDWNALSLEYYVAVSAACEDAVMQLEDRFSDIVLEYDAEIDVPGWKYLGSVLWAVEEPFSAWEMLDAACAVETSAGDAYRLTITIAPADYQPFLYGLAGDDRDLYMDARYIMTYLTTVFDAEGEEIDYVMPVLSTTISPPFKSLWKRPRITTAGTRDAPTTRASTPVSTCAPRPTRRFEAALTARCCISAIRPRRATMLSSGRRGI